MTTNETLSFASAGAARRRERQSTPVIEDKEVVFTQTDEEIRAEFEAARAHCPRYERKENEETIDYASAGITRRR